MDHHYGSSKNIDGDAGVLNLAVEVDDVVPSTLIPAIPTAVHFGLSIACALLYFLLFSLVYVQLFLILCLKHKRWSYQTVFLFLCLLWAALRTTLFSFYLNGHVGHDGSAGNAQRWTNNVSVANSLPLLPFWLLYCLPVCLQFVTLCLLVLYFSQVVFSAKTKYEPISNFRYHHQIPYHHLHPHHHSSSGSREGASVPRSVRFKRIIRLIIGTAVVTFTATNVTCAVIVRRHQGERLNDVVMIRVLVNEMLFLACGLSLAVCLFKLNKMTSAKLILETKGTTLCQTMTTCILIVILYLSRAIYNLFVLFFATRTPSFNFSWINITDQADLKGLTYVTFGVVLFVWEFLPTFIVVVFFRVRRPYAPQVTSDLSSNSRNSRAHFFDNPRRYDSDEELFKSTTSASHESPSGRTVEYYVARTNTRHPSPYSSFNHSGGGNGIFRHDSFNGAHSSADASSNSTTGGGVHCHLAGTDCHPPPQPSTSLIHQHQPLFVHARIPGSSGPPSSGRLYQRESSRNIAFS